MSKLFDTVTIIGIGLIGSSISRALQKHNLCHSIVIYDNNVENRVRAFKLGLGNLITHNIGVAVRQTDLVIICTPIGTYEDIFAQMLPLMDKDDNGIIPIITTVGSVMEPQIEIRDKFSQHKFDFVPGHPIAGTEKSGPDAGFAELFENRWTILNSGLAQNKSIDKIHEMWKMFGSNVSFMSCRQHDRILALTSHLPHLIAFSMCGTAMNMEDSLEEIAKYSAGGFRDFTRIAASDPVMWRDIFLQNKDNIFTVTHVLKQVIQAFEDLLNNNDAEMLEHFCARARKIRETIAKANQL